MGTRDWTTRASAAGAPVLFVVDADPQARAVTESALARRFETDYQVVTADAPHAGLDTLARLAGRGDQVALLAADLHLPGMDGVEFLGRAHLLHPGASRVLLWRWTATTLVSPSPSWRRCSGRPRSAGSTSRS